MIAAVDGDDAGHEPAALRVLPPSANWYCSQICDWGWSAEHGALVAFGAKNDVFVYTVAATGSGTGLAFLAQLARGRKAQRVTALRFLHDGGSGGNGDGAVGAAARPRVVCGSEAGHVQIWDVGSREVVEQHRKHTAEVTAVATAPRGALNEDVVVAGDRQGTISCWVRDTGRVSVFAPVSGDGVFSMAMSPRDAALVAVGFRSGVLCLVDAVQGVVLHRVDAHDQELQSLSWCLRGDHGAWLASSSRDKSIKIWRVGDSNTEGVDDAGSATKDSRELVMDRVLRLPTGKQGQAYNPSKHLWLPVAWSTATGDLDATETKPSATMRLWSGSFDGNLLLWEIPVPRALGANATRSGGSPPVKPVAVKNGHNRILFNIIALPSDVDAFHRQQQLPLRLPTLLTVSLDRELRLWSETRAAKSSGGAGTPPAAARTVGKLLGLGGHVYCVAHNEQASTVALACGDQTVRLWKLRGGKEGGLYNTELLWKGLKSKVTSVAWHPLAPSVLAFGTEDGTLGVYDTQSKKQTRFRSSHVGEVQQLEWRLDSSASSTEDGEAEAASSPSAFLDAMHKLERAQAEGTSLDDALVELEASKRGQQGDRPQLRVVLWSRDASGQLLESDAEHPDAQSLVVSAARGCSSFACSDAEDASGLVAIGNPNGSVKLVRAHLMKSSVHGNDKVVHDHNERISSIAWSTRDGARLLATGSDDGKIFVYRFDSDTPTLVAQLAGHSGKITRLRWQPSPPSDGTNGSSGDDALLLLASCAADGSARVWDVLDRERQPVARFYDHIGRVLALDWVTSSVLVTGGEDQTARMWDLRSFPAHVDAEHDTGSKDRSVVSTPRPRASSAKQNHSKSAAKEVEAAKKNLAITPTTGGKKKKTKATSPALFHSATPTPLHEVAQLLARRLDQPQQAPITGSDQVGASEDGSDAFMPALLLLAHRESSLDPRRAIMSFSSAEQTLFASEGDWEGKARLLLLGGQISDALRVVANEGMLDATWLAFAPMAGMDVWREMSNLFAVQLEARGNHAQAALHFLSVGKVRAAVRALVGGSAFREALALIRLRLGPSDSLVSETTWKFAEWLEARGSFGDAALAFVSLERCEPAQGVTTAVDASEATSWRWRAVRALVKTRSTACVAQAVGLLHEVASTGTSEALAFPATFLTVDMIGVLVRERQFAVAERASELLLLSSPSLRIHSSLPMATTSFRLTRCLLGILSAMDRHGRSYVESSAALVKGERLVSLQRQWPSNEAVQLLLALVCDDGAEGSAYPASLVADLPDALVGRADGFWSDVLDVCRLCGVWSAGRDTQDEEEGDPDGNSTLEEAQELLMDDESSWMLVEWRTAMAGDSLSSPALRVDAAIDVLRLVVDALAHCLVSAVEHLARLLADVVDSSLRDDGRVDNDIASLAVELVTLVFPVGVASRAPVSLLAIGELAEEQEDARGLWRMARLLQCRALVSRCAHVAATADARMWAADTARCVLDDVVEDCGAEQDDDNEGSHREALREELEALERDQLGVETS